MERTNENQRKEEQILNLHSRLGGSGVETLLKGKVPDKTLIENTVDLHSHRENSGSSFLGH